MSVMLKFPPIKPYIPKEVPDKLIRHEHVEYLGSMIDKFTLYSTKKSERGKKAFISCFPEYIERDGKKVLSLYIHNLLSNCSGSGFGTALLDFARIYSKKLGCNGYFHLTSDISFMPHRIPHPFFIKYGMNTGIPKIDKKIARFMKRGKNLTYKNFKNVEMYYPPVKPKDNSIKNYIRRFFKSQP